MISCSFFADGKIDSADGTVQITSLSLSKTNLSLSVGEMQYIALSVTPVSAKNQLNATWKYDTAIVKVDATTAGTVITGIKEGQTSLLVEAGGFSASCIIKVSGFSDSYLETLDPYIYSNTSVLQMVPNTTERFFVSLYGGTAADIDGYTWTIDNPSVATVTPTGQYCQVKAIQDGYARIKVTHTKAPYPYYIGIYVFADNTKATYITTTENIVTLYKNKGDKTVSVGLQNPIDENYKSKFNWEIINGDTNCVTVISNGANAVLTPVSSGICTIKVTHPDTTGGYPLDITVRVVEIVENVYIEPSETVITVSGKEEKNLTAKLIGLKAGSDYSVDDFTFEVTDPSVAAFYTHANEIILSGIKNGSCNVIISHPKSEKKRQVLVIVQDQLNDAVDASCYITTSQNYIKTKIGAEEIAVNILLKGGIAGDEKNFTWSVKQNPSNGISDVIRLTTADGNTTSARAAMQSYAGGIAYIEPLAEGTAIITLKHPKTYYPTEILVKVLPVTATLEDPLYFSGSGIITFLNNEEYNYSVYLNGNKTSTDENAIQWKIDNQSLQILSNGTEAVLKSAATGKTISNLEITHPKVDGTKKVLVLTADTAEELSSMKAFYADKLCYSINKGSTCNIYVNTVGFDSYDEITGDHISADFSTIVWTSSNPSVAIVQKGDTPLTGVITGIASGTAKITARYDTVSITFDITVYPENVEIGKVEKTTYLTTQNNVVILNTSGITKEINVSAIGMDSRDMQNIQWTSADPRIATVIGNGNKATVTSIAEGETTITVSHPKSENSLSVYVKIGSEYIINNKPIVYISSSAETITLTKTAAVFQLNTVLANNGTAQSNKFSYTIDEPRIATIQAQYATGSCFIKPVNAGIAELTVSNPDAVADKKILIIVGNTAEELAGFKYLSTNSNVVTISEGSTRTVSVNIKNTSDVILDGYEWHSEDTNIAGVSATSAATAIITGNKIGTTRIKVQHTDCQYPLEIIVQCIDPIAAKANPYIQTNTSVLTITKSSTWTTVTADLVGGTESDALDMQWESSDSSILQVLGQNGTGKIRAVGVGTAYVTVTHPKAPYPSQILIICDEQASTNCSISVAENIINLKPNAAAKTITASLINGDTTDKYNFRFSLDVYDVVDLDYSANTAAITPKQQGQVTLTISHPKSPYDQQIIIKVSEYTTFGFGVTNKTVTAGKSTFISMQIPATSLKTHVEYTSDSPLVANVQGTSAVCQLTGLAAGTTTIRAKLIATATNAVQAEAEMLVSVEEGTSSLIYISAPSTTFTMEKGNNKTLSATLTGSGVLPTDQYNLQWKSTDPNIVALRGASTTGIVSGQNVYAEALKSGETTITVSHEKSKTTLVFYIIVPGNEEKSIKLNKTYVTIEKGVSTEIKAEIDNGSTDDYNSITWTADKVNGTDIIRLMGNGKTVSVYGLSAGTATIKAQLPNGKYALCDVNVEDPKTFSFATTTVRVQPGKTKTVQYKIMPSNAGLQWVQNDDTYAMFQDNGNTDGDGIVSITGIKEGTSTLSCVTSYGNKATLQIICAWDYAFNVTKTKIQGTPNQNYTIKYTVNPIDAEIIVDDSNIANIVTESNDDGTGQITITPKKEGKDTITIRAKNPATKSEFAAKNVLLDFSYDSLTLVPSLVSKTGSFSRYDKDSGILIIGDGEQTELNFAVAEPNVNWTITAANIVKKDATSPLSFTKGDLNNSYKINHPNDMLTYQYRIIEGYKPVFLGKTGTERIPMDPKEFTWHYDHDTWKSGGGKTDYAAARYGLISKYSTSSINTNQFDYGTELANGWRTGGIIDTYQIYDGENYVTQSFNWAAWYSLPSESATRGRYQGMYYSRERDTSLDGRIMSVQEFEAIPWYYWPGYNINCRDNNGHYTLNWAPPAEILNIHIKAVKEPVTDKTINKSSYTDQLSITVSHNGKQETFTIPIYTEIRACSYNQQ